MLDINTLRKLDRPAFWLPVALVAVITALGNDLQNDLGRALLPAYSVIGWPLAVWTSAWSLVAICVLLQERRPADRPILDLFLWWTLKTLGLVCVMLVVAFLTGFVGSYVMNLPFFRNGFIAAVLVRFPTSAVLFLPMIWTPVLLLLALASVIEYVRVWHRRERRAVEAADRRDGYRASP